MSVPQRCLRMIEVCDISCEEMRHERGYYCEDCPMSAKKGSCPCEWTTPCSYACSCAHPLMSGGCQRCCKYGSDEQRKAAAEHIVATLEQLKTERNKLLMALKSISNPHTSIVEGLKRACEFLGKEGS